MPRGGERGVCSIAGCGRPHLARGWCNKHYLRWKQHGNPERILQAEDGAPMRFIEQACSYQDDNCLDWPFAKDDCGYPSMARYQVLTTICTRVYGQKPTPKHEVAHSCKQNWACCNPKHLRWATHQENCADMIVHGTHWAYARHDNRAASP